MSNSAVITNAALEFIGSQSQITALNDGSPEGNAAGAVYYVALQSLLRQLDPDFARVQGYALGQVAGATVPPPWGYQYSYPTDCLRMRDLAPPPYGPGALADPYDPMPIRWQVAFSQSVGGTGQTGLLVLTNQQSPLASYTTSNVTETQFDSAFTEAFVRKLASPLAMAVAGRPDFARELLEEAERYANMTAAVLESGDGAPA